MTKKEYIVELKEEEADELMSEHWISELVRCRECIRRGTYNCPIYVGGDADHGSPDDWYCADGERRETND